MTDNRYPQRIPHPNTGTATDLLPQAVGDATRALEARTNYLYEWLLGTQAGVALQLRSQAVAPAVVTGEAVYWDDENKQFAAGLAAVEHDSASGSLVPADTADVIGICTGKTDSSTGDVAVAGLLTVSAEVAASLTGGDTEPGRYYLSAAIAGRVTRQRPPVSVPVCVILGPASDCETDIRLLLLPQTRDFLEDHIHYQLHLVAAPAGSHTPPASGQPHEITSPDASLPGWLPADHASFNGAAPAGAVFGYNLPQHEELSRLWPPIPVTAAVLEFLHPTGLTGFEGLSRVPGDYYVCDRNGLWWMTDCYSQVPWAPLLDTTSSASSSASSSAECPLSPDTQLLLSFLRMTYANDKSVVTSLVAGEDQPIEYIDCEGNPARTGDLTTRLNLSASVEDDLSTGGLVLKGLQDSNLKFRQGWVAEGLVAGSEDVLLESTHTRLLDPDEAASEDNPTVHQGVVTVSVATNLSERELLPQVVRLEDTTEREYRGLTYYGFPNGRTSSLRLRYNIPPKGLPASPQLKIRVWLFGHAVGPFSAMSLAYQKVAAPAAGAPTPITAGDSALAFDVVTPSDDYDGSGGNLPADNVIVVESESFSIAADDMVFISLARSLSASPAYAAEIGVLRVSGVLIPG